MRTKEGVSLGGFLKSFPLTRVCVYYHSYLYIISSSHRKSALLPPFFPTHPSIQLKPHPPPSPTRVIHSLIRQRRTIRPRVSVSIPLLLIVSFLVEKMILPLPLADFVPGSFAPVRARHAEHATHSFGTEGERGLWFFRFDLSLFWGGRREGDV